MAKTKRTIAIEYRKKFGDTFSTRSLAKVVYKENPVIFKDSEDARYHLSVVEGKRGGAKHKTIRESELYKPEHRPTVPHNIPLPDTNDLDPYRLPLLFNNFILAGDFHVPNHRVEPIQAMLKYAKENNIKQLFLNGDLLDNTPFTRWQREPLAPGDIPRWFDMARALLVEFKKQFDQIYWLEGNHDFWYERYLMAKAPELFGDKYFQLENRLRLNELGVIYIKQKFLVKAGHLNITHGHLLLRGGGGYANAARMLYMKTKANTICSHVHVESSHTEPDLNDKIITTFSTGCMCTLRPEYQPYGGKACHGFAHITIGKSKDFSVKNYRIYKGEIL
jgi:predicted phosphodiesterase